jgi:hypothetical protein
MGGLLERQQGKSMESGPVMELKTEANSKCERMRRFEAEIEIPSAPEKAPLKFCKFLHG